MAAADAGVDVFHLDEGGNVLPTHSVSAGLDYPAIGPEHAQLKDSGRARYVSVTDEEAIAALNEMEFKGQKLQVNEAKEREESGVSI